MEGSPKLEQLVGAGHIDVLTGLLAYRGITTQKLEPVATSVSSARQPIAWVPGLNVHNKPVVDAVVEAIPVTSKVSINLANSNES